MEEKRINMDLKVVSLERVNYQGKILDPQKIEVKVLDSIDIINIAGSEVTCRYVRSVSTSNNAFNVEVAYLLIVNLNSDSMKLLENDPVKIHDFIEKIKINISNDFGLPARASSLISSLTINGNLNPLITSPIYLENKTN